eukprot:10278917-Ditylum_brightwellii.AAC.1
MTKPCGQENNIKFGIKDGIKLGSNDGIELGINWAEKTVGHLAWQMMQQGSTLLGQYVEGNSGKIFDTCVCWQKPLKQPQPL